MAHVEKRGQGRWRARHRGADGKERSQTFPTRRAAERWLATVETAKLRGEWVAPELGRTTVAEFAAAWWATTTGMRPSTRARDETYLTGRVLPHFGPVALAKVGSLDVQAWVAGLEADGLAPATVAKCHQILAKILRAAVDAGHLAVSPCGRTTLPRVEREEMRFLDPAEVERLAATIDGRYRPLVLLGAYGGLRAGEMFGLRAGRVDLLHGRVDVAEIVVEVRGHHHWGAPKTRAGRRRVPVPRVVVDALTPRLAGLAPEDLVFPAPQGGTVRASLFRRRTWQPACAAAGLDGLRVHDLRHTAVALWIAAGASPKEIAARAGHSSVSVVLDRYGHLYDGSEAAVNDRLDDLAAGARDGAGDAVVVRLR